MTDASDIAELLRRIERHLAELVAHVRQTPLEAAPAPADPVDQLRRACRDRGFWISAADEVRTDAAAALLGMAPQTLRQDRSIFGRIPSRKVGGRVLYRLTDLAERLASVDLR